MTETNWRSQSLPESFKALNKKTGGIHTCERTSDATYRIGWKYAEDEQYWTHYAEGTLKEIIYKDKAWEIMEDVKVVTHHKDLLGKYWMFCDGVPDTSKKQCVTLTDIQEFCKENSAEITFAYIHGEPHYDVFFGDSEVAQTNSDEELVEIMKAIRVLYGNKG